MEVIVVPPRVMHRGEDDVDGDQCIAPQIMEFSHLSEAGKGKELILL